MSLPRISRGVNAARHVLSERLGFSLWQVFGVLRIRAQDLPSGFFFFFFFFSGREMLRSSEMARLYGRFLLQTRGIVNYKGVGRGSGNGIRRPSSPSPPPPPPPPPPSSSSPFPPAVEKEEWWAVDGELFRAEKFDPKQVLSPLENEHIPNTKRRKDRMKHLAQTRLKFRNQVS